MSGKRINRTPSLWKYAGLGVDLAAAVGGFTLIGYWADRHWQTSPRYTVVGAILGLIGGMYNLVRSGMKAAKDMDREEPPAEDSLP